MLFEEFGLSQELLKNIKNHNITEPTEIQAKSIPAIIKGQDVIGESATGSGKTLAFGAGIIETVVPGKGLQALVLTPTRELAEQVNQSIRDFSRHKRLKVISIYGGVAINPQMDALRSADVAVCTPGRLLDHMERRTVDLSKIRILVLDEADRMLDMGFIDDVEKIIRQCPKQRQTMFFSATIMPKIRELSNKYMKNTLNVAAKKHVDPSKLKQVYYNVQKNVKLSLLLHLFKQEQSGLAMVFCNSRRTTDFVVKNLRKNRFDAIALHGGLSQNKRTRTIESFNKGKAGVLVCTDVAARGLHIDNVSHIINYEIPNDPTDYVHRIGRTARAGEEGKVINLLSDIDHDNFSRVMQEHRSFKIQVMETPKVERINAVKADPEVRPMRGKGFSQRGDQRGFSRQRSSDGGPRSRFGRGSDSGQSRSRDEGFGRKGFAEQGSSESFGRKGFAERPSSGYSGRSGRSSFNGPSRSGPRNGSSRFSRGAPRGSSRTGGFRGRGMS